jgi:hypothetical protein
MSQKLSIKAKDRDAIIQSLRAGVVPRLGLQHIQVGRQQEISAVIRDVDRIAEGGASARFIIGSYGAGKTFFLFLVRQIALQRKLVVMQADLGPDRRIHATGGQAQGLYSELAKSMATRTQPDGGALRTVLDSFVAQTEELNPGRPIADAVTARLNALRELNGGYDFATIDAAYARRSEDGEDALQSAAIRWLRGEYSTKTEARADLGVRTIIDDAFFYDALRLMAKFVRLAGFSGLLVSLDEMVNLYKLQSAQARKQNYEQILRIVNDALQGTTEGLGVIFAGTPEFLMDTRRGLFSYPALQGRLAANSFASDGLVDMTGPVISLQNLTVEELLHLLERLRDVFASGDPDRYLVPDEALQAFLDYCRSKIGEAYFQTPRNTVKAFVDLLAVLEQNPGTSWRDRLGVVNIDPDRGGETDLVPMPDDTADDDLATIKF